MNFAKAGIVSAQKSTDDNRASHSLILNMKLQLEIMVGLP
jgi:hypothetical protein